MAELLFIEGVSGVGKSTMVHSLTKQLCANGYIVKSYVEFDYTNPIDFYCTAYVPYDEYEQLCREYAVEKESIRRNSIIAGDAILIRYYDKDTPLFAEPLLSKFASMEFCYNPTQLVPIEKYTSTYKDVFCNFIINIDSRTDYYIFDGSLLHHPINDMMRNYHASSEQIMAHIQVLVKTLTEITWRVCYLVTDVIAEQLERAYRNRGQCAPTKDEIAFWETRYTHDLHALKHVVPRHQIYNVSNNKWDTALREIILSLR